MFIEVIEAITKNGFSTVVFAAVGVMLALNYKSIASWIWITIQAGALVKSHEETIAELKEEIKTLREKLEEYNKLLIDQTAIISRLEERIIQTAKDRIKNKNIAED